MPRRNSFALLPGRVAATLLLVGCGDALAPERHELAVPAFSHGGTTHTAVTGLGAVGGGAALPFMDRQEFDFDADGTPGGRLLVRDYSVVRANGTIASFTADAAADPATGITSFSQTSATCATFGGIGRVDTGDLFAFTTAACDHGSPGAGVDSFSISIPAIGYSLAEKVREGEIALSGAAQGDLDVAAATTGSDLDPDGYTVTLNGTTSRAIGVNTTIRFSALPEGSHTVALGGLAANCTLSGANPRAVTVVAGQVVRTTFDVSCAPTTPVVTRVRGLGTLGNGLPLPTMDRVEFDFDVTSASGGRVVVTDYEITRSDGSAASMTVDPATDPATGVSSFSRTSATCVRFGGVGRLNDSNALYEFVIDACDHASPGAGADTFSITLPKRPYSKSGTLTSGDIAITTS